MALTALGVVAAVIRGTTAPTDTAFEWARQLDPVGDPDLVEHYIYSAQLGEWVPKSSSGIFSDPVLQQVNTPPVSPNDWDRVLVGSAGVGAFSGQDNKIAIYNGSTWEFFSVQSGTQLFNTALGVYIYYTGSAWDIIGGNYTNYDRYTIDADNASDGVTIKATSNGLEVRNVADLTYKPMLVDTPTLANHATTKAYVDSVAIGLRDGKESAELRTTGNITLSGEQTIDGTLTSTSRVLVAAQTDPIENGIYVTGAGAWTRATDFDEDDEVTAGAYVFVTGGTLYANTGWQLSGADPISVGVDAINWFQFSGGLQIKNMQDSGTNFVNTASGSGYWQWDNTRIQDEVIDFTGNSLTPKLYRNGQGVRLANQANGKGFTVDGWGQYMEIDVGTQQLRIVSGTSVTIGRGASVLGSYPLDVNGDIRTTSTLRVGTAMTINGTIINSGASSITMQSSGDVNIYADGGAGDIRFRGDFAPTIVDNGYNIGFTTARIANIRMGGEVQNHAGGLGYFGNALTATGDEVLHRFYGTVNKATSGNYTGISLDVTETAAPGTLNSLLTLATDGTPKFYVYSDGTVRGENGLGWQIDPGASDVNSATFRPRLANNNGLGASATQASLVSTGVARLIVTASNVTMPGYGSGTKTGTAAYSLAVDASGNIIEEALGGGGGAFTADAQTQITPSTSILLDEATGDEDALDLSFTVNKATSGNYRGVYMNVTETSAPGTADKLMDLQVGSTPIFQVANNGNALIASATSLAYLRVSSPDSHAVLFLDADPDEGQDSYISFRSGTTQRARILYDHHVNTGTQRMQFIVGDDGATELQLQQNFVTIATSTTITNSTISLSNISANPSIQVSRDSAGGNPWIEASNSADGSSALISATAQATAPPHDTDSPTLQLFHSGAATQSGMVISLIDGTDSGTTPVMSFVAYELTPAAIANRKLFSWYNYTTEVMYVDNDGGVVVGTPTGASQGAGTVNAVGLYDDSSLVADYVFEARYKGKPLEEKHSGYKMKTLVEEYEYTRKHLHLSTIIGRKAWEKEKPAMGILVSQIWETVETQFIYLVDLAEDMAALKSQVKRHEQEISKLQKQIAALS